MGEKTKTSMPREVAELALGFASPNEKGRCQISFFGGEPLLHFDLLEKYTLLAEEIVDREDTRLKFVVTTNGTCFNDKRLEFLREHNFFLGLSIDGISEAQNAARPFRTGADSFDAVYGGLKKLLKSGVDFETISVINPNSVQYLGESVRFLLAAGVRRISLNPNFAAEWSDDALETWGEAYQDIGEAYKACFRRGHLVHINMIDDKIITHLKDGYKETDRCEFGRGSIAVAPSGNIYPCERLVAEDRDGTYCIGTVFEGFTPRRQCLTEMTGNCNEDCKDCALDNRCMSWCACTNLSETGEINQPGGVLCWHEQMAISNADSVASALYNEENPLFLQNYYLR